jgi:hypothetical protein
MGKLKKTNYILIGTYKTNPENSGWYINFKRYSMLWKKLEEKFKKNLDSSHSHFSSGFGKIKDIENFYFYDLKKYDSAINSTKDKEVFKLKREDFVEGLQKLLNEIMRNPNINYRIGLQGNNSVGLFMNFLVNPDRIKKVELSSISRDFKELKFGKILLPSSAPANVCAFKIYNLTQPARSEDELNTIFHKTWNEFLEI